MSVDDTGLIGRRLREVRAWRGLSLRAAAELAGLSASYLSRIERGERPVERRSTLQALAAALRVAPSELTGQPFAPSNEPAADGHTSIESVREALRRIELGDLAEPVPVDGLVGRVDAARAASLRCDYQQLGAALPGLALDTVSTADAGSARARSLVVPVMRMTFQLVKDLGFNDVAWQVVGHAHRAAQVDGDPAWIALTQFDRARAMVGTNAPRAALKLVHQAADEVKLGKGTEAEAYGMLRLSAALQSAITGADTDIPALLDDAEDVAGHTGEGNFGDMSFGPRNVAIWRMMLAVESGDLGRVPELAADVDVAAIPSLDRQGSYYLDLGRGLTQLRGRETDAVEALSRSEAIAPQLVHANPYARETVAELLRRARRDAGGRELRGMAYRMGIPA